jgi:copper oxidase (laccase) domain-containing protein
MEGLRQPMEGDGPWHVDLREVLAEQGRRLGISEITVSDWCSAHDADRFYSHRRSRGADGRMAAYLGAKP